MRPALVALLCSIVPFLAVHIAYISNVVSETVPECFPYLEGCLTISRAARSGDSIYIFRALMMPTSMLLVAYWLLAFAWLKQLCPQTTKGMSIMRMLGAVGALFLVLYVTYLGTEGEVYRWMRRYGVIFYFSFTALAQIFLIQRLYQLCGSSPGYDTLRPLLKGKLILCVIQWGVGLISVPLGLIITDKEARDIMQNIIEWNFALAMNTYFFITYLMFRKTGFKIHFALEKAL